MLRTVGRSGARVYFFKPSVYPRDMDTVQTEIQINTQGQFCFYGFDIFQIHHFEPFAVFYTARDRERLDYAPGNTTLSLGDYNSYDIRDGSSIA